MTLEDAEKLARKILDEVARGYTPDESWSDAVADALVAILPVVKAVEALTNRNRHLLPLHLRHIADALAAMRARMGEK